MTPSQKLLMTVLQSGPDDARDVPEAVHPVYRELIDLDLAQLAGGMYSLTTKGVEWIVRNSE